MTTPRPDIDTDPSAAWQDGYDLGVEHGELSVEKPSRALWMLAGAGIVIAVQAIVAIIGFAFFAFAINSVETSSSAVESRSTPDVLDGLALPTETSAPKVTTTRSAVSSETATEAAPGDLAQTCPDALAATEFFVSMDPSGNS